MENILTTSNIMFAIGIITLLFSVWSKVKNPQDALDKQVAVEREEVEGKAKVLEQRVQWEKEANEKRFSEFGRRLDDSFLLASNHTKTVDTKVDMLIKTTNDWHLEISNKLTRIETLMEERKN